MTVPTTSPLLDFAVGIARILAAQADPAQGIAYDPAENYSAGQTGIYYPTGPDQPSRIIVFAPWVIVDRPADSTSTFGLQIRTRTGGTDVGEAYSLDAAIARVLLGYYPLTLPTGIRVQTLVRSSTQPPQRDDQQRWNGLSNWTADVHVPSPHRQ